MLGAKNSQLLHSRASGGGQISALLLGGVLNSVAASIFDDGKF